MKKLQLFISFFLILFCFKIGYGQTASSYTFTTGTGAILLTPTFTSLLGTSLNDNASIVTNIGFTFVYEGINYTQFSVNANGLLRLGSTVVSTASNNTLSVAGNEPKIAPFWDNLNTGTTGYVKYGISGSSPNSILVVEFFEYHTSSNSLADSKVQVKLYETTNVIEFVYETGSSAFTSYSCGIGGETASNYQSVTTNANTCSNAVVNNSNTAWPGSGRYYRFTPPPSLQATSLTAFGNVCPNTNSQFCGIWNTYTNFDGCGTLNVYFNSINIQGIATSGANNSYGFMQYKSTGTVRPLSTNLKNNIFNNVRNGGTGIKYAIYKNNAPTSGNTFVSDYNEFRDSATGLWTTTNCAAITDWRTASANDNNSNISAVPTISFTNAATCDLHINASLCSFNGFGTPITGITTDYDNQTRASLPDIGADEFDGTGTGIATWAGTTNSDWNTRPNWACNQIPTQYIDALIPNVTNKPVINNTDMACKNLTIDVSSSVTINAAKSLTVYGNLIDNGTLTLKSPIDQSASASLITLGTTNTGTGNVEIERYLDYATHYISIPFATEARSNISAPYIYSYLESVNDTWDATTVSEPSGWTEITSGNLLAKTGYAYIPEAATTLTLTENSTTNPLNTGNQNIALYLTTAAGGIFDGWNLIGNPYPSAIDWNTVVIPGGMESAVYYYDDVTGTDVPNQSNYRYYIPATGTGGTYGVGSNGGSQYVPSMQGFFVRTANNATLSLTDLNRTHSLTTNYYKNNAVKEEIPANFLKLKVTANGITDETVIRIISDATYEQDALYDAYKMYSLSSLVPQIYSITPENISQAISSIPEINYNEIIPLGFSIQTGGNYSIEASQLSFTDKRVFLKDELLDSIIDLSIQPIYYFPINDGVTNDRFKIIFKNNHLPNIENQMVSVDENTVFDYDLQATDEDLTDILTYSITNGSEENKFSINSESGKIIFDGFFDFETTQTYNIEVSVSDGLQTSNANLTVNVIDVNEAPFVNNPIENQSVLANEIFNFTLIENIFTDVDFGDFLTYSALLTSDELLPSWLTFIPETRTFNGTPKVEDIGIYSISVKATDILGLCSTTNFDLTVDKLENISEKSTNNFSVFPNPNNGIFYINSNNINKNQIHFEIVNILGQTVYKGILTENITKIDLTECNKSIFIIKFNLGINYYINKIIIN